MIYDLKAAEFDPVKRAATLAEALGEVVPDLLGQMTIQANPYVPDISTIGAVTSYTVSCDVKSLEDNTTTPLNFSYTSSGLETYTEIIEGIYITGKHDHGDKVTWAAFTDYSREEDMYFTMVPKEGYMVTSVPVVNNINISTDLVQAPSGKPAAYMAYQHIDKPQYPLLVTSPLPVTSINENWTAGSVELDIGDGLKYYPYYDNYIRFACKVTIESGAYDQVLKGNTLSAEGIFQKIKLRLKDDNRNTKFINKINATYNPMITITPSPVVGSTEWMSIASTTLNLDIIERYVELEGGIMTRVEFTNSDLRHKGDPDAEILMNYSVERTDIL